MFSKDQLSLMQLSAQFLLWVLDENGFQYETYWSDGKGDIINADIGYLREGLKDIKQYAIRNAKKEIK